ncbi:MAG: hypothetical protein JWM99_915 [Verrucomicrobiales bacterium]|nr:hypothetical protein [Verrucomicrobiales bacterium]
MIYADTSFLVAVKVRRDNFHVVAADYSSDNQEAPWLWSPWHRIEVFNTVRQLTRHPDARRRLQQAEAKALIHRLEADVRLGYFMHLEADWRDVLASANELSAVHGYSLACHSADLLHVAFAREISAETFITFDEDQLDLAKAAGMKVVRPGKN